MAKKKRIKKLKIYLAGPINNCTYYQTHAWRDKVKNELRYYYNFIDPSRITDEMLIQKKDSFHAIDDIGSRKVENDLKAILSCDIILANMWCNSVGTIMELVYSKIKDKKIILVSNHKSIWYDYHSTKIVSTLDEAIEYLIETCLYGKQEDGIVL